MVPEADDKLSSLRLQSVHAPLCFGHHIPQLKAGGGRAGVGVHPHQAEQAVGDSAPLQEHVVLNPVGRHGAQDVQLVRIAGGWLVVGHKEGGSRIAAFHHGVEHIGKAGPGVVKLVVANGGGVIAHGAHGAQLRPLGGVQGLDQRANGEVAAVYGQSVGMGPALPVQGGFQAGVAPRFVPLPVGLGQKVGVEVVGKEHRSAVALRGCRQRGQKGTQQQNRQQTGGNAALHGNTSSDY